MMIFQLTTESGHPVLRASSASERGELDSKDDGKKSTQFDDNKGNIEMLLRTVTFCKSVQHLRSFGGLVQKMRQEFILRFS